MFKEKMSQIRGSEDRKRIVSELQKQESSMAKKVSELMSKSL